LIPPLLYTYDLSREIAKFFIKPAPKIAAWVYLQKQPLV